MKSILFLGYSNLVKSRILPLIGQAGFSAVSIAKYEEQSWDEGWRDCPVPVTLYDDYETGLKSFTGELVYVSTVNSMHFACARAALERGFHTIIDKPATTSYQEAFELVSMARSRQLFLGESTVYLCHPQLAAIRQIFTQKNDAPKLLTVHFTMPPFQPSNFRYQLSLGGGAIMDTAPYAISVGRYFFDAEPEAISCVVTERQMDGLDTEYSLLMRYPGGRALIGHFGFNTEYLNQVLLIGNRTNVQVNRIFTIPDTMENTLAVRHKNQEEAVVVAAGNNFLLYLKRILCLLDSTDYEDSYNDLLSDAKVKDRMKEHAV